MREETGTRHGFDSSRPAGSFVEVVREVLLDPRGFFAGLRAAGGGSPGRQRPAVIFAIIASYISLLLLTLVDPLNRRIDPFVPEDSASLSGFFPFLRENQGLGIALGVLFLVVLPLLVWLGAYIGAAIQHLFVMLFVRDRQTFYATFPVGVYGSSALGLFSWVPILGYLVSLYGVYVTTVGLREMHGTTTTRALLAALVPYLIGISFALPTLLGIPASPPR